MSSMSGGQYCICNNVRRTALHYMQPCPPGRCCIMQLCPPGDICICSCVRPVQNRPCRKLNALSGGRNTFAIFFLQMNEMENVRPFGYYSCNHKIREYSCCTCRFSACTLAFAATYMYSQVYVHRTILHRPGHDYICKSVPGFIENQNQRKKFNTVVYGWHHTDRNVGSMS